MEYQLKGLFVSKGASLTFPGKSHAVLVIKHKNANIPLPGFISGVTILYFKYITKTR